MPSSTGPRGVELGPVAPSAGPGQPDENQRRVCGVPRSACLQPCVMSRPADAMWVAMRRWHWEWLLGARSPGAGAEPLLRRSGLGVAAGATRIHARMARVVELATVLGNDKVADSKPAGEVVRADEAHSVQNGTAGWQALGQLQPVNGELTADCPRSVPGEPQIPVHSLLDDLA